MKKITLLCVFLCFFIAYGNTTQHELNQKFNFTDTKSEMISILDHKITPENISPEIEKLFLRGFHIATTSKMRAWVQDIQQLNEEQYTQYLNYWAYFDAQKYSTPTDTALVIMLQRIPISQKFFGKMPNKLTDKELAQLGNVMINNHLAVSVDKKTWLYSKNLCLSSYLDLNTIQFDTRASYIEHHVSVDLLDNFSDKPYFEVVHYDVCRLMAAAQLNITPVTDTKKVILRYNLGAVLMIGGERFILSQLKFTSS